MNEAAKQPEAPETPAAAPEKTGAFARWWSRFESAVRDALPEGRSMESFKSAVRLAFANEPKFQSCTDETMGPALIQLARLGLEPDRRYASIIPYEIYANKKPTGQFEANATVDYKGVIKLLMDCGAAERVTCEVTYAGDKLWRDASTDQWYLEVASPTSPERGDPTGAIAVIYSPSGSRYSLWMPAWEIEQARSCSKNAYTYDGKKRESAPWWLWWTQMWCKSALLRLTKFVPWDAVKAAALSAINDAEFGDLLDRPARLSNERAQYSGTVGVAGITESIEKRREAGR